MKRKVTTMIDNDLSEMFEKTKGVHGLTFGEAFEQGMRAALMKLNESNIIDQEITRTNLEVSNLMMKQNELKNLKESISKLRVPIIETNNNGNGAEELEVFRNKRFLESYPTKEKIALIKSNLEKCIVNWERIMEVYKFKNKDDARTWMEKKVSEVKV